jgi:mannose-6-phosphate isomerase
VALSEGGVAEQLDTDGRPLARPPGTLTQARTVFALAHLHLATGRADLLAAARRVNGFLNHALRDGDGGFRLSTADGLRRSYDQSFALLALVTLRRADPAAVPASHIDALWHFIETRLCDPETGLLRNDDGPGDADTPWAQNPHMHMLEAALQAFEMTGDPAWRDRAAHLVGLCARHFIDPDTGAVCEFIARGAVPLAAETAARREPGHQYEWAWLLHRLADLGGDPAVRRLAEPMVRFAETHGLRQGGPMAGAPYDALDAAGRVSEDTHLLWPLTEAGKYYAATGNAARARDMGTLIFGRYFAPGPAPVWVNRLDGAGGVLWDAALSRLVYHVAIFVTEGARAGLWPLAHRNDPTHPKEDTTS